MAGGRSWSAATGMLATPMVGASTTSFPRGGAAGASVAASTGRTIYSWTSSMRVPNAPLGWTNATVVPLEPGRAA